ncbi:MAG: asparagine synthase (glutamine-hydrolyzing) [Gaiellaceae bacterium]
MCGICGMVGADPVDRDVLGRMTKALRHRGPDDDGFLVREYDDGAVGLGFRRLSIIDLASGNQPIHNEDGAIQLIFNGEVYNYRELRRELEAKGHRFSTNADTEVIVHLYEDAGVRCVERLNGMFAFALWDEGRRQLLLARDRFGKKPLYYFDGGRTLLFASELKSLLEHPSCPRVLDWEAVSSYLALEYVPTPRAIFEGVRKLPAGYRAVWREGALRLERYWDLSFDDREDPGRTEADYVEEFRALLATAVRRRLVSEVPLGAFLSGGVDSTSVVALMAAALPAGAVKTFTISFGERSFDESAHARRVAKRFGTEHHEEVFTAQAMLELLPTVADVLDEPFADASVLPTYLLSRFTREHVTVALGGDGADELIAGYPTFSADRLASLYVLPRGLNERVVLPLVDRLPVSTANFSLDFKLKRFLRGAGAPPDLRHPLWLGSFSPAEQDALLTSAPAGPFESHRRAFAEAPTTDRVNRLVYLYAKTYLQDDILVKVDRASMACSLEVRAPFLDIDLAEFLGRVPSRLKLHRFDTKHLLKQALADDLPAGIARRKKKGFGVPVADWIKGELREAVQDELSAERLSRQGLFEPAAVERLLSEHLAGRRDNRKPIWTLFVFQLWHRRWAEKRAPAAPIAAPRSA